MIMNDMTDFDKLIKEKAEQASYPYDEVAWKQYKRKAGIHSGSAKYWVIGASSVLVAGVSFLLLTSPKKQTMPDQSQPAVVSVSDSVMESQNLTVTESEDTLTLQVEHKANRSTLQSSRNETGKTLGHQSVVVKDTPKVTRKTVLGRPVVINVDTITRMVPTDEELEKGHSRLY